MLTEPQSRHLTQTDSDLRDHAESATFAENAKRFYGLRAAVAW